MICLVDFDWANCGRVDNEILWPETEQGRASLLSIAGHGAGKQTQTRLFFTGSVGSGTIAFRSDRLVYLPCQYRRHLKSGKKVLDWSEFRARFAS